MPAIAVVAHAGKSLGGGLGELREVLAREGITDPFWYEVTKSRKAPKYARRALAQGAEVIFEGFDGAQPDDGLLELGLVTARNPVEWARALARVAQGRAAQSPFIEVTRGKRVQIRLDRPLPCELDGGARAKVTKMRVKVHPGSVKICVPDQAAGRSRT